MPLLRLAHPLLALPRPAKRAIALVFDASLIVFTVWVAFYARLDMWVRLLGEGTYQPMWAVLASCLIALPLFVTHGFYRVIFRYSGISAMQVILRAFAIYTLLFATVVTAIGLPGVPRSVGIIQPMLLLLAVGASRAVVRYWLGGLYQSIVQRMNLPPVIIYGAGRMGRQLAQALANSNEMRVIGYLDDDSSLHDQVLNGLPVHNPVDLQALVRTQGIRTVLLAMPSLARQRRNSILDTLRPLHVAVRTLPNLSDMVQGRVSAADLHELDIDDLLYRELVEPNETLLAKNIREKVVLVSGAGGSIGSELCRQIIGLGPTRLLLVEQSEFALYSIQQKLETLLVKSSIDLVPILASIQDAERMRAIMSAWHPDTVYHAAAYKHLPLVERNPAAGIKNNVLGTLCIAEAAAAANVADFVLISTDKAVRPTNVMGASKRLAEMILQAMAATECRTKFSIVRFGNVLGSSGSVVPKFRQQIKDGGPVTLTHSDVARYFMTIPEAAQLVIQAGAMAVGGDVFVLNMGSPVRIVDLARRMIELSGHSVKDKTNPEGDIEIEITGLRPGEKLYEELLIGSNPQPTLHSRIMKANEEFVPLNELRSVLATLEAVLEVGDETALRGLLEEVVEGYSPRAAPDLNESFGIPKSAGK